MENKKFTFDLSGKTLEVEEKNLAQQANGNILVRLGDTLILCTCVMSKQDLENLDFFPLTVEYEEKYYAAGKIKGSRFIKRESRPSDEAICNARLIDRAIRPRFPQVMNRGVQVVNTVLSWDTQNDPDVLGLLAASLALSISDIPWNGPISAIRVIKKDGKLILSPTYLEREAAELDIVFAGLKNSRGELLVNMIEGGANEVKEEDVLSALDFGYEYLEKLIDFQNKIKKEIGKEKIAITEPEKDAELEKEITEHLKDDLENAVFAKDKNKRNGDVEKIKNDMLLYIEEKHPGEGKKKYVQSFFDKEIDRLIHENAIQKERRADDRKMDEVREINCEVGLLPRTHGSGLFTRGQTKALSILTLGSPSDQQLLEGMEISGKKRFMHHYNFPPYSTGEIKPMRGPGRREIGHGMLAEKALIPLIPSVDEFPYTIRVVSEIVSSNGSSSMASVSSSCLALMDAGVPIKRPAAGIAIGLASDEETGEYKILTDIQGPEDHHGDMDFKVAGTTEGITAIQMDVKCSGITKQIITDALKSALKARLGILDTMKRTIDGPRSNLSQYAPRIITLQINPGKIGEVIGPGGKVINEIIDNTGASIDIEDSGLVYITAEKEESAQKALEWVKNIVREVQVGEVFDGKVKRILEFGAFVEILPGQEGMIHISKLGKGRVERVQDVLDINDQVSVKVISIDELGRINLSLLKKQK
jgi:polyribonucleotide nucleotidyltransferase